jgi:hypothetical protein
MNYILFVVSIMSLIGMVAARSEYNDLHEAASKSYRERVHLAQLVEKSYTQGCKEAIRYVCMDIADCRPPLEFFDRHCHKDFEQIRSLEEDGE